jgi:hypothetical protein
VNWRRDWWRLVGIGVLMAATGVAATQRAEKQQIGTDFHVFWQAGYDFAHGLPLYQPLPGARTFKFPPFAAQVFQVLGILPLRLAAWLFYVASVALVLVAAGITSRLVQRIEPARRRTLVPLLLALLCSAVFVLDNLVHVQVNQLTFVLCLVGIAAFVAGREVAGTGWLVAATAIKLTPLFFVIWAVIRGSRRALAGVVGFGALTVALPIVQRGVAQGLLDLTTYYHSFIQQFASGFVVTNYRNQNLAAMIYRAVIPRASEDAWPYDYAYLPSLQAAAPLIYRVLGLALLAIFLAHLIRLRTSGRPVGALEVSSVFLVSHLLSGITWKAHLVTLLFVFYVFFTLDIRRMSRPGGIALGLAWAAIMVIGLGRDLVGSRLHHYFAGYSVFVWVMLLLFGLSVAWSQRPVRGER